MAKELNVSEEDLEEIIERKVRERLGEEQKNDGKEIEKVQDRIKDSEADNNEGLSRRDFLKSVGAGTAAAGAVAMLPSASALDFESGSGFSFSNQTSTNFELGSSGDLNLKGGDIQNAGAANVDKLSVGGDGPAESFSEIGGVSGVADAVVKLENGIPTAYRADGSEIAQDANAAIPLQVAANHVHSNGGGSIVFGSGTFPVNASATSLPNKPSGAPSNQITMYSNLTVRGQGMGATVLKATGETQIGNTTSETNRLHYRDFTYDGQNQAGQTTIYSNIPSRCSAHRVGVVNCGARSGDYSRGGLIWRAGGDDGRNEIVNCYAKNTSYVSFSVQKNTSYNRILGCVVEDPNTEGNWGPHPISVESNNHSVCANNTVIGGGNPAINVNAPNSVVCANNTTHNTAKGINIANGGGGETVVANNAISNTSDQGIRISITSTGPESLRDNLIIGNTIRDWGKYGIEIANGAHSIIKNNVLVDRAGNGGQAIVAGSAAYPPDIIGNFVYWSNDDGIEVGNPTTSKRQYWSCSFNKVIKNKNTASSGRPFLIKPGKCQFIGNRIMHDKAQAQLQGENNIAVANMSSSYVSGGANSISAFNMTGAKGDGSQSLPTRQVSFGEVHSDYQGQTVTLSTGSIPAARVDGVSSTEEGQPAIQYIRPVSSTTPTADYSFDYYFEWDSSAGAWDLVIEWRTDPGSNIDVEYAISSKA